MTSTTRRAPSRARTRPSATAGDRVRGLIESSIPAGHELTEVEEVLLVLAAAQADELELLEKAIARDGVVVDGAAGQKRVHGAVGEARQARLALSRLLGQIRLPGDTDEQPMTHAQRRAQKAAEARWSRTSNVRALRRIEPGSSA